MGSRRIQVAPQHCAATTSSTVPTHDPRRSNNAPRTSKCVKYTMFFKNMMFFILGSMLIAIGIIALKEKDQLNGEFDNLFLDPAAILFAIGAVIFIISFCGALGALRENKCLLHVFWISITVILVLEVALCGAVYGYRVKIREKIDDVFQKMVVKYHDDPDLQAVIDYVQHSVKCCGSSSLSDWENNLYYNCSTKADLMPSACSVPFSCCKTDTLNRMCGYGVLRLPDEEQKTKVYTRGCLQALEDLVKDNLLQAGIVGGCFLLLQFIAVWLARRMVSDINAIIKWRDTH